MRANKVAVVTGAQRGIGYVIAARFVAEGASVVLADINNASSQVQLLSANGGVAMIVQTDVTRDADVKQLVAQALSRFGHIDIWVNNAGIEFAKTVVDTSEDEWDQLMAVNLKGVFLCSRAVLPGMIERISLYGSPSVARKSVGG
jgi:NAD(P)-dependent dehydrogenase (short-subunit alcohol dehydrogenase family)